MRGSSQQQSTARQDHWCISSTSFRSESALRISCHLQVSTASRRVEWCRRPSSLALSSTIIIVSTILLSPPSWCEDKNEDDSTISLFFPRCRRRSSIISFSGPHRFSQKCSSLSRHPSPPTRRSIQSCSLMSCHHRKAFFEERPRSHLLLPPLRCSQHLPPTRASDPRFSAWDSIGLDSQQPITRCG